MRARGRAVLCSVEEFHLGPSSPGEYRSPALVLPILTLLVVTRGLGLPLRRSSRGRAAHVGTRGGGKWGREERSESRGTALRGALRDLLDANLWENPGKIMLVRIDAWVYDNRAREAHEPGRGPH